MRTKGQINAGIVWTIVIMLAAVAFGGLIFGKIHTVAVEQSEGSGTTYTDVTLNSDFSDNTNGIPDNWENVVTENRIAVLDNYGITNRFLQDNDNGICYWYQTLAISNLYDSVSSATVNFAYQISDNSGLDGGSHKLKVLLGRPGGDNVTIWENLSEIAADNGTWHTQENTVTSYINATGTYTFYLFDNAVTAGDADTDNVVVRWDNASLSVSTYGKGVAEIIVEDVGETGADVFPLIVLMVLIGVFVGIIAILKVLG